MLIVLVFLFVSCGNIDDKKVSNDNTQNEINLLPEQSLHDPKQNDDGYSVKEVKFTIGKHKILVPEIIYMNNINKQKAINSIITKSINEKITKYEFDLNKGEFFTFEFTTKFKSEKLLSFLFRGDYYIKGAAHPSIFAFSINIDLDKSIILEQNDIITVDEDIAKLFINGKFIGKNEISKSAYLKYSDYANQERAMSVLRESEVCFSNEGIEFIIDTNYAMGGYMLLELSYALLEDQWILALVSSQKNN